MSLKDESSHRWLGPLLAPFEPVYGGLMVARSLAYAKGLLKTQSLDRPVISVGNLSVGGTGKTPMIAYLIEHFAKRGLRAGVISRGYGRSSRGIYEVSGDDPTLHGDEPSMLKALYPSTMVYVGERRVLAGRQLLSRAPETEIVLADDAFQHLSLYRDLDVVLVDATRGLEQFELLPRGLAREPKSALRRSSVIVITKVDVATTDAVERLETTIRHQVGDAVPIARAGYRLKGFFRSQDLVEAQVQSGDRIALLSGVARPQALDAWVARQANLIVVDHFQFEDHHSFDVSDLDSISARLPSDVPVLTTEKDWIKIRRLRHKLSDRLFIIRIGFEFLSGEEVFCDLCDGVIR